MLPSSVTSVNPKFPPNNDPLPPLLLTVTTLRRIGSYNVLADYGCSSLRSSAGPCANQRFLADFGPPL